MHIYPALLCRAMTCLLMLAVAGCGQKASTTSVGAMQKAAPLDHPLFNEAFEEGFTIVSEGNTHVFHTQAIGDLKLASGNLVACDPLVSCDEAFSKPVPKGSFPLKLAIARKGDDERIAFARIFFAPGRIESWELAVTRGQDAATLKKGEIFGYGVDSGTGGFMDVEALRAYDARRTKEGEEFDDFLLAELDKSYRHTRSWYVLDTDKGNVAMFSSGYGDGVYATYRGYDKAGNLIAMITDFGIVPWEQPTSHRQQARSPAR